MPVVKLLLRRETRVFRGESDRPEIYAPWRDEVELDELTPRARALAEAFAQQGGTAGSVVMERDALIRDTVPHWEHYYPDRGDDHPRAVRDAWPTLLPSITTEELPPDGDGEVRGAASVGRTAVQWLERTVRTWPLDWYVVSASHHEPVPSMAAGAADRYLVPGTILEYMREGGRPMDVTVWDALRGTSYPPAPDRFVCDVPQWSQATVDAFIQRPVELWPVRRVAEHLGYTGPSATSSARKQLTRWRLPAVGREPGRNGESLHDADQIRALQAARPGSGRRGAPRKGGKFTAAETPPF